jgi:hypothetical protein
MELKKKGNYQNEYEKLGTVRQQQDVPEKLPQETKRRKPGDKVEKSEFEKFWGLQRDLAWAELPGIHIYIYIHIYEYIYIYIHIYIYI